MLQSAPVGLAERVGSPGSESGQGLDFGRGVPVAPVKGGAVDLRTLVGHRHWLAADASLESAHKFFSLHELEFVAVWEGDRVCGICARRQVGIVLGSRYGFSLFSRNPVREYLLSQALVVAVSDPIPQILEQVSMRPAEYFYDDVLLVDEQGAFLGAILVRELVKLQHGLLLENIREAEQRRNEIERQNRQMEQELMLAGRVQQAMLPQVYPEFSPEKASGNDCSRLGFAHRYLPAGKVSGDFFHIHRISEQVAGVLICDVMGHGVRSAMITAMMRALVKELHSEAGRPGKVLAQLNRDLHAILSQNEEKMYASAIYLTIDTGSREVRWASAGHPCPLQLRRNEVAVELLKCPAGKQGKVLGLFPQNTYETCEATLKAGDRLLLYTDGIYEVFREDKEFGVEGFMDSVRQHMAQPVDQFLDRVLADARSFGEGENFEDDVCLLAMGFE